MSDKSFKLIVLGLLLMILVNQPPYHAQDAFDHVLDAGVGFISLALIMTGLYDYLFED